ncbi:hypothetical protein GW17_00060805 [Ensete ventricosum]|nr:hypothetical protein GW17_00060805 [Ensete ventricosum]
MHRWRLPFAAGNRPRNGRPPLRSAPRPLQVAGLAVAGRACGWLPLASCCPFGQPRLVGHLVAVGRPLQVARPWPTAPAGGLAMASHLCMQTACMWPPYP